MGLLKGHGTCHFIYILQICEQKLSLIDCSVVWLFSCDSHSFFNFFTGRLYFYPDEGKCDFSYVVTCSKLMIHDT